MSSILPCSFPPAPPHAPKTLPAWVLGALDKLPRVSEIEIIGFPGPYLDVAVLDASLEPLPLSTSKIEALNHFCRRRRKITRRSLHTFEQGQRLAGADRGNGSEPGENQGLPE